MSFLGNLGSLFAQQSVQAIAAGLVAGVVGGTALVATGIIPVGGTQVAATTVALLACPDSGPVLAQIPNGQAMLVTARSSDGTWLQVYVGQPGVDRGWAPADSLDLQSAAEDLPVADCAGPTPAPLGTPAATAVVSTPAPEPTPPPTELPSAAPTPTAGPTPTPTARVTPRPTIRVTPQPTVKVTPSATPVIVTPPPDTTKPTLSGLNANPTCVDSGSSGSTISVQVTDNVAVLSVSIGITPPGAAGFVVNMTHGSGNTWFHVVHWSPNWGEGHINYAVTAQDTSGNQSDTAYNDPLSPNNWLYHSTSSCFIG